VNTPSVCQARTGRDFPIIVIREVGLDGFWIHRVLQFEGIESHVVDAASILPRAGVGGRRLTGSMARSWCAVCRARIFSEGGEDLRAFFCRHPMVPLFRHDRR
jgi:transposase